MHKIVNIHYKKSIDPGYFRNFNTFESDNYSVYCHKDYKDLIQNHLTQITDHQSKNNQVHRNLVNIIYQQQLIDDNNDIEIVVKKSVHRTILQKFLSIFKQSKAIKAFVAAKFMLENNLDTPTPLAVIEKRNNGLLQEAYYVTEAITPHRRVRKLFKELLAEGEDFDMLRALMFAVANYARDMHQTGFMHKDLNLSNFLIHQLDEENFRLTLIDLNRGAYCNEMTNLQKIRDISRLYWKELRNEFFFIYCDSNPNLITLKWFYDFYYRWRLKRRHFKRRFK